nr:TonB family protein [Rhodospirillaceae bacterium]
ADSSAAQQSRTRLAELMLHEAMVAITDEEFDIATRWISNARALDVPEDMTKRFEVELQKARDAKSTRQVESLGTIFASATPAAILADPSIDYGDDRESAPSIDANEDSAASGTASIEPGTSPGLNKSMSLAMVLPGALPGESNNVSNEFPAGELVDTAQRDIPLSALEFKKFVEPKTPRGWRGKGSGWVDIRFRITTEGRTEDITIVAAEPDDRFDKPAISAISKWRFKPVYVDGIASEKYSAVRLRFKTE